jgi:hypothetical protein
MSGGGVNGLAFIGCIKRLEELNIEFDSYIGTSFGSLILFMLALGMTSDDMIRVSICNSKLPSSTMSKNKNALHHIARCINHGGIDDASQLLQSIRRPLIERLERNDITFLELKELTGKDLTVVGSNLTHSCAEYFNSDLTPNMSVVSALRISASIPVLYDPVVKDDCVFVDGALFDNLPISLCHDIPELAFLIDGVWSMDAICSQSVGILEWSGILIASILRHINSKETEHRCGVLVVKIPAIKNSDEFGYILGHGFFATELAIKTLVDHGYRQAEKDVTTQYTIKELEVLGCQSSQRSRRASI